MTRPQVCVEMFSPQSKQKKEKHWLDLDGTSKSCERFSEEMVMIGQDKVQDKTAWEG